MVTNGWDVSVYFLGCLKDCFAFFNLDLDIINEKVYSFWYGLSLP